MANRILNATDGYIDRDYRFKSMRKQVAKVMGVQLDDNWYKPYYVFGPKSLFVEVWGTKCGNDLVISGDNYGFRAVLVDALDYRADAYNRHLEHDWIEEAVGLRAKKMNNEYEYE